MNQQSKEKAIIILNDLKNLLTAIGLKQEAFFIAAKFCPEPFSSSLVEFEEQFFWIGQEVKKTISELNSLLDDGASGFQRTKEEI